MKNNDWSLDALMTTVNEENVNSRDAHGFAPIHYLAGSGGLNTIMSLANLGADLNLYTTVTSSSEKPLTPGVVAIKNGQVKALNLLLSLGADSALQVDGLSMWAYAIRHKTLAPELTSALIVNGADLSQLQGIIAKYGAAILTKLEVQPELVEKIAFVVNGGAEEILEEYLSPTPIVDISKAFEECDIESVVSYVKDKRVSDKDKYAANLFAAAAMQGGSEYIKMMVALSQAGYEINRKDSDGFTPIQKLGTNNVFALCMLLTQGAKPNEIGPDGFSAVHKAIKLGDFNTLNLLLENGGDPNLPALNKENPLVMVMQSRINMSEMFYVLVAHGADVSGFDIEGMKLIAGDSIDPESVDLMIAVKSADSLVLTGKLPDAEGDINQKIYYARLSFFAKSLAENYEHLAKIKEALSEGRDQLGQDEEMDTFIIICKNIKWKEMMSLDRQALTLELGKYMHALGLQEVKVEVAEEKAEELVDSVSNITLSKNDEDTVVTGDVLEESIDDF